MSGVMSAPGGDVVGTRRKHARYAILTLFFSTESGLFKDLRWIRPKKISRGAVNLTSCGQRVLKAAPYHPVMDSPYHRLQIYRRHCRRIFAGWAPTSMAAGEGAWQGPDRAPRLHVDLGKRPLEIARAGGYGLSGSAIERATLSVHEPKVDEALAVSHGLKPDEYARFVGLIGRAPTFTELGVVSAMWNE